MGGDLLDTARVSDRLPRGAQRTRLNWCAFRHAANSPVSFAWISPRVCETRHRRFLAYEPLNLDRVRPPIQTPGCPVRNAAVVSGRCSQSSSLRRRRLCEYFGRNKVHYDRFDFQRLQTEHFDIYFYEEEAAATRQAARMAERWYARFSRLLGHTFARRQPLVLYASHPHFSQTNLTAGSPSEGTGGFTERAKSRIAMPFAAALGRRPARPRNRHAFQIEIAKSVSRTRSRFRVVDRAWPSIFLVTARHTQSGCAMRLSTIAPAERSTIRGSSYSYGHAFWSYLAALVRRHCEPVLRRKPRGGVSALEETTGSPRRSTKGGPYCAPDSVPRPARRVERFRGVRRLTRPSIIPMAVLRAF